MDLYLDQQAIDTTTPMGKLVFQVTGAFAEFERTMIRQRIKAGLKRAVAQGVKLGRPKIDSTTERKVRKQLAKGVGILKVAKSLGIWDWHGPAHRKRAEVKRGLLLASRAEQRASGRADPPPPFLGNQKSVKAPPENARIFSFRGLRETGLMPAAEMWAGGGGSSHRPRVLSLREDGAPPTLGSRDSGWITLTALRRRLDPSRALCIFKIVCDKTSITRARSATACLLISNLFYIFPRVLPVIDSAANAELMDGADVD